MVLSYLSQQQLLGDNESIDEDERDTHHSSETIVANQVSAINEKGVYILLKFILQNYTKLKQIILHYYIVHSQVTFYKVTLQLNGIV